MIRLNLTQTTSLHQRLAPQLIQSLRLLQMPTLELEQVIQQELEINPLLELDEGEDTEEDGEEVEETSDSDESETEEEVGDDEEALEELEFDDIDLDKLDKDQFDEEDWSNYLNESGYSSPSEKNEFDPNVEDYNNDGASQQSLEDSLLEQLLLSDLSEEDQAIGHYIIGNIDEDGYFRCPIEEIADVLGLMVEEVERVLLVIQSMDPSGVGARDLRECLMIQLKEKGLNNGNVMPIVRDHLDDLINRRFNKIIRSLGLSTEELSEAEKVISGLNPKPGFDPEPRVNMNLIVPDLEVQKIGDEFIVSLTDRNAPSLRVSPVYRTLLNQSEKAGSDAKKFVVDRLNSARWFIKAIHQRRTTMLKVMKCIVENQIEFFEKGPGNLRPMRLQKVADNVEMHISTISRVSNGKYVQTPYGVFELKYFFDGSLNRDDGGDVSAKTVKGKIAEMILEEDSSHPLSDQKIADVLKEEGIEIARRTVAKYREQMKILSARYRKSL